MDDSNRDIRVLRELQYKAEGCTIINPAKEREVDVVASICSWLEGRPVMASTVEATDASHKGLPRLGSRGAEATVHKNGSIAFSFLEGLLDESIFCPYPYGLVD